MRRAGLAAALAAFAALGAGGRAGCGGSAATTPSRPAAGAPTHAGSSVTTEAAADHLSAGHVSRRLRAQEAAIHRQVTAALRAGDRSTARYGGVPRALRGRQAPPRDQVLSATPGHPAEPISGVAVRLRLSDGASALALGVGPYVPLKDQGSFRNHTNATWRVTFSDVHGLVPIRPSMFTLTDEQGQTLVPRVSVLGGGALPSSAPAGRTLTVVLAARTSIGSGTLYYTPSGRRFLAAWDFDAETD